jgi:hypothetical protein
MPRNFTIADPGAPFAVHHPSGLGMLVAAGTYQVTLRAGGYRTAQHVARLVDPARGVTLLTGSAVTSDNGGTAASIYSIGEATITLHAEAHLDLEIAVDVIGAGTDTAGVASGNPGIDEFFSSVRLERVGPAVSAAAGAGSNDTLSYAVGVAFAATPLAASISSVGALSWSPIPMRSLAHRVGRKIAIDHGNGWLVLRPGTYDITAFHTAASARGQRMRLRNVTAAGDAWLDGVGAGVYSLVAYGAAGSSGATHLRHAGLTVAGTSGNVTLAVEYFSEHAAGEYGSGVVELASRDLWATVEVAEVGATFTDHVLLGFEMPLSTSLGCTADVWNRIPYDQTQGGAGDRPPTGQQCQHCGRGRDRCDRALYIPGARRGLRQQ